MSFLVQQYDQGMKGIIKEIRLGLMEKETVVEHVFSFNNNSLIKYWLNMICL